MLNAKTYQVSPSVIRRPKKQILPEVSNLREGVLSVLLGLAVWELTFEFNGIRQGVCCDELLGCIRTS
ncbi:hypothetical protein TFLX_04268 [Thermoflexales bacterium]|nr:hypothetical protein TFLX_04268 [Thermoflexales bacterium]